MKVMTFGEIMLRLKTPEYLKILQADGFEASYGGAESNVAVSLAMFGDEAAYVTKIPDNPVGLAALGAVRRFGVDTSCVLHGGSRLGIYYFEKGTNIRPTNVVYDREYSALALADAAGLPRASSLKALTTFTGLAHRFQLVLEHNGVRWINDSKATNVGSTEAALNGLQLDGTLYLLLGGDGKSADFTPLKRYLGGDRIRLYCFGRDGAELAELRPEVAVQTETMEQAMRQIAPLVKAGDMVLLSPACASLDQFKNFEQRGEMFARLAKELG